MTTAQLKRVSELFKGKYKSAVQARYEDVNYQLLAKYGGIYQRGSKYFPDTPDGFVKALQYLYRKYKAANNDDSYLAYVLRAVVDKNSYMPVATLCSVEYEDFVKI
jgi:hypothetical protein